MTSEVWEAKAAQIFESARKLKTKTEDVEKQLNILDAQREAEKSFAVVGHNLHTAHR